jgi:putative hydrolase of the HAD superfamily
MNYSNLHNIKGLVFDLDDTLYHAEQAYIDALKQLKLSQTHHRYAEARKKVKQRLPEKHVSARNRLLYFKKLYEDSGDGSPTKILEKITLYENALQESLQKQWQELNRIPLLKWLRDHFTLVILTNENTRTQLLKMAIIDPDGEYFSAIITSEEIGVEKPNELAFSSAMESLNLSPEQCLMIGDSLENDIIPAIKFGMSAIWSKEFISDAETTNLAKNLDFISIAHLDEIKGILSP